MPIYEYVCKACGAEFEQLQRFSEPPLEACQCGQEGTVSRKVSLSAFQLRGGGWYKEGYGAPPPGNAGGGADGEKQAPAEASGAPAGSEKQGAEAPAKAAAGAEKKGGAEAPAKAAAGAEKKGGGQPPAKAAPKKESAA